MAEHTILVDDDEVIIVVRKPEGYDDVCDELVAIDAMKESQFEWRLVEP